MKKVMIIIFSLLIIFFIVFTFTEPSIKTMYLKDYDYFKKIDLNEVYNVSISKYTEGGVETDTYIDKSDVDYIYKELSNIQIKEETNKSCDDNSIVYSFNLKNGKSIVITIECEWIIINNKKFLIE